MGENAGLMEERRREMAWRCPKCGRTFRHHVFDCGTPAAGPMCNGCAVELEWAEVEVAQREAAGAARVYS